MKNEILIAIIGMIASSQIGCSSSSNSSTPLTQAQMIQACQSSPERAQACAAQGIAIPAGPGTGLPQMAAVGQPTVLAGQVPNTAGTPGSGNFLPAVSLQTLVRAQSVKVEAASRAMSLDPNSSFDGPPSPLTSSSAAAPSSDLPSADITVARLPEYQPKAARSPSSIEEPSDNQQPRSESTSPAGGAIQ